MRSIGLDVHRDFCEVAISDGGRARSAGRVPSTPEQLELFAQSLGRDDRVVLEATGNAFAILRILEPHVAEVVLAHSKQLRAISHAKVKSDKVDVRMLAELLALRSTPETGDTLACTRPRMPFPDMRPSRGSAGPGPASVTAASVEDVCCIVRQHDALARQAGRIGAPPR
jgi:Transposase